MKKSAVAAAPMDSENKRLWKKFQNISDLPDKDRRAVIRLINSLVGTQERKEG